MRIAYLGFSYPALSQTFIVREVQGLREQGFEVETWGIRAADPATLLTDEYRAEAAATRSLRPVQRAPWRGRTCARCAPPRAPTCGRWCARCGTARRGSARWGWPWPRSVWPSACGASWSAAAPATCTCTSPARRRTWPRWCPPSAPMPGAPVRSLDLERQRARAGGVHRPDGQPPAAAAAAGAVRDRRSATSRAGSCWRCCREPSGPRCGWCGAGSSPGGSRPAGAREAGGPLRILYVGRLVALKGQPVLLDALAGLAAAGVDAAADAGGGRAGARARWSATPAGPGWTSRVRSPAHWGRTRCARITLAPTCSACPASPRACRWC